MSNEPLASDFAHMSCGGWCLGECPGCCECRKTGCSGCDLYEPEPSTVGLEFDASPETLQRLRDALRGRLSQP